MTSPEPQVDKEQLIRLASEARANSYSPYSHFRVGAALLAKNGKIYTGCNVESGSFTPTMCAERVALGNALSAGEKPGDFTAIAVVADNAQPTTPCGVCRQIVSEIAPGVSVIMAAAPELGSGVLERTIEELLPYGFKLEEEQA
jgi:cytidine deaminase